MMYSEPSVEFLLPHPSTEIVTKHELGFPFPLGTFLQNVVQIRPQSF